MLVCSIYTHTLFMSFSCWIKSPAFYFAFLSPVIGMMLMNLIVFVLVLRQIIGVSGGAVLNKTNKNKICVRLHGAILMIILLGLTYLFGMFAIDQASLIFYYLFTIFNSLQGLFIFLFYCVYKYCTGRLVLH